MAFSAFLSFRQLADSFLYDLIKDVSETTNLSWTFPDVKNIMLADMLEWRQSVIKSATHEVGCYGISAAHQNPDHSHHGHIHHGQENLKGV